MSKQSPSGNEGRLRIPTSAPEEPEYTVEVFCEEAEYLKITFYFKGDGCVNRMVTNILQKAISLQGGFLLQDENDISTTFLFSGERRVLEAYVCRCGKEKLIPGIRRTQGSKKNT